MSRNLWKPLYLKSKYLRVQSTSMYNYCTLYLSRQIHITPRIGPIGEGRDKLTLINLNSVRIFKYYYPSLRIQSDNTKVDKDYTASVALDCSVHNVSHCSFQHI